jgi:hypothetical protein
LFLFLGFVAAARRRTVDQSFVPGASLMNSSGKSFEAITAILLLSCATLAVAAEPAAQPSSPSKETREQMAAMHDKMAVCLRSDRAFADCQREMHQSCQAMMHGQGCPMMEMGRPKGMMRQDQPE